MRKSPSVIPVVLRTASVRIKNAAARTIGGVMTTPRASSGVWFSSHGPCVDDSFLIRTEEARRTRGSRRVIFARPAATTAPPWSKILLDPGVISAWRVDETIFASRVIRGLTCFSAKSVLNPGLLCRHAPGVIPGSVTTDPRLGRTDRPNRHGRVRPGHDGWGGRCDLIERQPLRGPVLESLLFPVPAQAPPGSTNRHGGAGHCPVPCVRLASIRCAWFRAGRWRVPPPGNTVRVTGRMDRPDPRR
jgi:hypothetical protein